MIDRGEVLTIAGERDLRVDIIEKDYVLGWMLAGIFAHPILGPAWVFKGGTCLKKCFLETYRLSEDLDFTVEDAGQLHGGIPRGRLSGDCGLGVRPQRDRHLDPATSFQCLQES